MGALIRKDSLDELIGHRNRAMEMYLLGFRTMVAAVEAHKRACVGSGYVTGLHWEALRFVHMETKQRDEDEFMAKQRVAVDGDMWRALLVNTNLASMMDKVERDAFEKGLRDPPEISIDTVMATLTRLAGDAQAIFRRGLAEAFRRLSTNHKSNDGFSIGERMVIKRVVTVTKLKGGADWVRTDSWGEQILRDIDRCLHVLSGRPAPQNLQGIVQAVQDAVRLQKWEAESDLLRVKWHKNGNGHLWIKSEDLRRDVNHQLALHFGSTLGAGAGNERRGHAY